MKSPLLFVKPTMSYLGALVGRRDPVSQIASCGLPHLETWKKVPEQLIFEARDAEPSLENTRAVLYCYEGPHAGEFFSVRSPITRVGADASAGIVLTPGKDSPATNYEFIVKNTIELRGVAPYSFELNGQAEYQARLVDYDEVLICGNRFLVLEIQGENT